MLDSTSPIDMHVHLVGNGRRGSGCWMRLGSTFWEKPLAAYMLAHIGLRGLHFQSLDFDERYVETLLRQIRESSLGAACLLAQDEVYESNGTRRPDLGTFYVPNDYVLKLSREHPEFLPVVSIHPARLDAMEELERCIRAGAVMLKLLPNCHSVDCNDRRFRRFWERMAEARLPLLAHTGGEHTLQVLEPRYSDPRTMTQPLECGVTVIAAHAATKSGLGDPEYFHIWAAMLERWPNLYGDTSAWNVPLRGRFAGISTHGLIAERLLHGSDFPVPVHPAWARLRRFISDADWQRTRTISNVVERDYQIKIAMGFEAAHFTRIHSLLRISPADLSGGNGLPASGLDTGDKVSEPAQPPKAHEPKKAGKKKVKKRSKHSALD